MNSESSSAREVFFKRNILEETCSSHKLSMELLIQSFCLNKVPLISRRETTRVSEGEREGEREGEIKLVREGDHQSE